jgi:hypothetical protein
VDPTFDLASDFGDHARKPNADEVYSHAFKEVVDKYNRCLLEFVCVCACGGVCGCGDVDVCTPDTSVVSWPHHPPNPATPPSPPHRQACLLVKTRHQTSLSEHVEMPDLADRERDRPDRFHRLSLRNLDAYKEVRGRGVGYDAGPLIVCMAVCVCMCVCAISWVVRVWSCVCRVELTWQV